jgi:hypothetical protein
MNRWSRLLLAVVASCSIGFPAQAARVGVLSNNFAAATAADLAARIPGHTFTAVDVSGAIPTVDQLLEAFDVILLFEDSPTSNLFASAPQIGFVVGTFALTHRAVVIGSFYDQDRSDNRAYIPHGWGLLESLDPNTTDGVGTPYVGRTLDPASIVAHPLTAGVTALFASAGTGFAGGNEAKPGSVVVANWSQPNVKGTKDPAIAYRVTGYGCVIHIGIAPDYGAYGAYGSVYGGDFYRVWQNAFDYGAAKCPPVIIPGDPGQIIKGWPSRAALDAWRVAFPFAIILDANFIQSGFGPALLLAAQPDGSIQLVD